MHLSEIVSLITLIIVVGIYLYKNKKNKLIKVSNAAALIIVVILPLVLTGCDSKSMEETRKQLESFNEVLEQANDLKLADPDNLSKYLNKDKDLSEDDDEIEEIEKVNYIEYMVSQKGYDDSGALYAVKVDRQDSNPKYSLIGLDEVEDTEYVTGEGVYKDITEEYIAYIGQLYSDKNLESGSEPLNTNELKEAIMYEADALLYLECFPEGTYSRQITMLAGKLAELIYQSSDRDSQFISLKYNCAAILAKASYTLEGWASEEHAMELSKTLWEMAEKNNTDIDDLEINRAWAAAELFRYTGQKTYRTIVEAAADSVDMTGFSYDNPGYYCSFAYMSAAENTNYELSSRFMNSLFDKANSIIKEKREYLLEEACKSINNDMLDDDFVDSVVNDSKLAIMANRISMSVEYRRYVDDRIMFLCGCNPCGVDYLSEDYISSSRPMIFTLCGINK